MEVTVFLGGVVVGTVIAAVVSTVARKGEEREERARDIRRRIEILEREARDRRGD